MTAEPSPSDDHAVGATVFPPLSDTDLRATVGPDLWARLMSRKRMPSLYRVLGQAPSVLGGWISFAWPLRWETGLSERQRELVIMYVAWFTGSRYEWSHHYPLAIAAGLSAEHLGGLPDRRTADLPPADHELLDVVTDLLRPDGPDPMVMKRFVEAHGRRHVIEVSVLTYFYVMVARVVNALGLAVEDSYRDGLTTWPPARQ